KTYIQNQILGRALLESILLMDGRCIVSVVSKQTMEFYGVGSSDLDGIVNQLLLTIGVDCAIFMYELAPLEYKVSLRSNGAVNVASVAEMFGGGGHVRASGCTVSGTSHDVINNITKYIHKQLYNE
ncbi:MAG: bifunctional oligoribonuclease/PAP phosphatase NrnA, partial [Butyrivibrio sp.]|nr:bifunctional oligoribonuclease/PAP phosphatase NrnA [Butyrivibrio sp.]